MFIRKFYNVTDSGGAGGGDLPDGSTNTGDNVTMNLREDNQLGKTPGETLQGQIVAARYSEEIQEKVIEFRQKLDSYYLTCQAMSKIQYLSSRELSLAVTAFQSARQFTGKILKERGAVSGYGKEGTAPRDYEGSELDLGIHTSEDAEKNRISAVESIGALRDMIEETIIDFGIFGTNVAASSWIEMVCLTRVMSDIMSGKMWLGELLAKIAKK